MNTRSVEAALSPAARIWQLLEGSWRFERTITPGGRLSGSATFCRASHDSLVYHEAGDLVLDDGTRVASERSYLYLLKDDEIEIRFRDGLNVGEHFVTIGFPSTPGRPRGEALFPITSGDTHLCRLDRYDASFRFDSPDRFTIIYVVFGPKKDYVSRSEYRRV